MCYRLPKRRAGADCRTSSGDSRSVAGAACLLTVTTRALFILSLLYWGLRAIDPKLVVPDWAPPLPFANDLQFHALPAVVLVLDLLFFSPPWTIAVVPAVGLSAAIAVAYYVWVEHCYAVNKFYPYPIFDEVGFEGRVGLFVGSAVVMAGTMVLLKWVYGAVNGREAGKARPGDVKKRA